MSIRFPMVVLFCFITAYVFLKGIIALCSPVSRQDVESRQSDESKESVTADFAGDSWKLFDGEGGPLAILAWILLILIFGAVFYLLSMTPVLLAELAVIETGAAADVLPILKREEDPNDIKLLKHLALPFRLMFLSSIFLGLTLSALSPGAQTLADIWRQSP